MTKERASTDCRSSPDYPVYKLAFVPVIGLRTQVFLMVPDISYFTKPTKLYLIDNEILNG